jgi:hypothetical protein
MLTLNIGWARSSKVHTSGRISHSVCHTQTICTNPLISEFRMRCPRVHRLPACLRLASPRQFYRSSCWTSVHHVWLSHTIPLDHVSNCVRIVPNKCNLVILTKFSWGLCEGGNIIAPDSEAIFYGILDLLAKPVFGAVLLFGHRNISPAELGLRIRGNYFAHPEWF